MKKNHALGFVLTAFSTESSSEEDKVEVHCSSQIKSTDINSNENTEEFSENEATETKTSRKAATGYRMPKAPSSKTPTQEQKVKSRLTEDKVEDLCDKLEIKREELDGEIKKKLDSSANLSFYPSRMALMAAVLADKVVLNEATSEFEDDFIEIIHNTFHSSLSATNKKAEAFSRQ